METVFVFDRPDGLGIVMHHLLQQLGLVGDETKQLGAADIVFDNALDACDPGLAELAEMELGHAGKRAVQGPAGQFKVEADQLGKAFELVKARQLSGFFLLELEK